MINEVLKQEVDIVHSAVGTIAGFEYQFFYFILRLFDMQDDDDEVAFEKLDDVSLNFGDSITCCQLKHTVRANLKEGVIWLAERDLDLWKSLSVWIDIIKNTGNEILQEKFIETHKFVLVTNKDASKNIFVTRINELKLGSLNITDIELYLDTIIKENISKSNEDNTGSKSKYYISVNDRVESVRNFCFLEIFLKKISIQKEESSKLEDKIKEKLRWPFLVPEYKLDDAFRDLLGEISSDLFKRSIFNKYLSYSKGGFIKRIERCIHQYRSEKLNFKIQSIPFENNLLEEIFIKQLIAVHDIDVSDTDDIAMYASQWFSFANKYEDYRLHHRISDTDDLLFKSNAHAIWYNKFKNVYSGFNSNSSEDEIYKSASILLDHIRSQSLSLLEQDLGIFVSNGSFYYLSDGETPSIGWHLDWKSKFQKNG